MFKDYIKQQNGVEMYSILSLIIFVAFFAAVVAYAMMRRKSMMQELSNLPLESDSLLPENNTNLNTNGHA